MAVRTSEAEWRGDLQSGKGVMKVGSGAYEGPYTFESRFESGAGTNPEELIGAAHAGCYSMALSNGLAKAGFPPTRVHTTARVTLDRTEQGVFDLAGNVSEWVMDRFEEHYPPCGPACTDPVVDGPPAGGGPVLRMLRGGDWNRPAESCRSAERSKWAQQDLSSSIGFRCAAPGAKMAP